jgi:hypothetical protein
MQRFSRFSIALALVGILAVVATGVWAAPIFQGTVPSIPVTGGGSCDSAEPVDMGTAIFTPLGSVCDIVVTKVTDPASTFIAAPEGTDFVGDTFIVEADPSTVMVQVCYAYPPEFAEKNAQVYKFNDQANPFIWEAVTEPEPVIENGTYCITTTVGTFSLIGNP